MSYDVSIGFECFNYTSNMAGLFHRYIHYGDKEENTGWIALHGVEGHNAAHALDLALIKIAKSALADEKAFQSQYDSPNGWGTTFGAIMFMIRVRAQCLKHPKLLVTVCQ